MPSSRPYESKVLTFFLRQLQQGLERHRRAVRQAQNTAAWGLQVALSPLQAIHRATQMAGRQMGAAQPKGSPLLGWFRPNHKPAGTELTRSQQPEHLQTLPPEQPRQFSVSGLIKASANFLAPLFKDKGDSKSAGILVERPQTIFKSNSRSASTTPIVLLEPPIAELIEAIQHWLLPEQRSQLWQLPAKETLQLPATSTNGLQIDGLPTDGLATPTANLLNLTSGNAPSNTLSNTLSNALPTPLATKIQGIASDLTTRSLLLVRVDNTCFDMLTQPQQALLKQQIAALMTAYWQYRTRVPGLREQIAARLPLPPRWKQALLGQQSPPADRWRTQVQQILTGPSLDQAVLSVSPAGLSAFEPAVSAGAALPQSAKAPSNPLQGSNIGNWFAHHPWLSWLVASRGAIGYPQQPAKIGAVPSSQQATGTLPVPLGLTSPDVRSMTLETTAQETVLSGATHSPPVAGAAPAHAVLPTDATVIGYVEHPLEMLLRWVDQGLTWLETLWSRLRTWYQLTFQ